MRRFRDDRRRGRRRADRRRADRRRGRRRADHCRALEHSQGARSSSTLLTWLQTLFAYYQFSDLRVLAPDEMRAALSQLYNARGGCFELGDMDDANECFEVMCRCVCDTRICDAMIKSSHAARCCRSTATRAAPTTTSACARGRARRTECLASRRSTSTSAARDAQLRVPRERVRAPRRRAARLSLDAALRAQRHRHRRGVAAAAADDRRRAARRDRIERRVPRRVPVAHGAARERHAAPRVRRARAPALAAARGAAARVFALLAALLRLLARESFLRYVRDVMGHVWGT